MISDTDKKKSVKIKVKCFVCDFKTEFEEEVNKHGFFAISDAYCPNDFSILDQVIDGLDLSQKVE